MSKNILVFLEQRDGKIKKSSFEAIGAAKIIGDFFNIKFELVVVGSEIANISHLEKLGAAKVTYFKSVDLALYSTSAYSKIVSDYVDQNEIKICLLANSAMGNDLAPKLSIKNNAEIITDCTNFELIDDSIVVTKPIYAGKALTKVKINSKKMIFTVRPNVFKPSDLSDEVCSIDVVDVTNIDLTSKVIEFKKSSAKLDVAEADIVVAGGRGLKEAGNFSLIEKLANELNAAVGASRAVVDAGWRPHSEQVGQTGKTVSPLLYIAVGISGAIQHLAGMSSSKCIVAINKDKDAPIFEVANYGITGDLFEVIPALIDKIKKIKEN